MINSPPNHPSAFERRYLARDGQANNGNVATREPSLIRDANGALIVHSATKRSTAFIDCGGFADAFCAAFAAAATLDERNKLVDEVVP